MISNDDWMMNPNRSDRMLAKIEYLEATMKQLKKMVDVAELAAATNADRIRDLEAENARLRAALKPVLESNLDCHPCDGYCQLVEKVKESKRIYNGGAK